MASKRKVTMKILRRLSIVLLLAGAGLGGASAQTLTTLYSFSGGTNGAYLQAGLAQGSDGNFYGTTQEGGTNYHGTVFAITPQGTLTTLWQFGSGPTDGSYPYAGLVRGNDGNLYGTTHEGGTNGFGTVFKITSQGTLSTLWQFGRNSADGTGPEAGLVQGSDGNFYGTTYRGGLTNSHYTSGCGTLFKITSQGTLTTLWQFNGTNGMEPSGALVQGTDGNFYGTTYTGATNNCGTVFKITSQGTLTTLWQFGVDQTKGADPLGIVQGSDGSFYGTSFLGGTNFHGTVFRITSQGTLTTLWQFGTSDGNSPYAADGLVQGSDGSFYGTTYYGGLTNLNSGLGYGVVFKLSVPLNPPANQISSIVADSSGTNLVFSIPSVAYETYQLQFSPSMNPTNWVNVSGVSVTNSIGALLTLTNFGGALAPQGFYRFAITP
jgi:uncharacterized repeat protein (TIGR03803 family)